MFIICAHFVRLRLATFPGGLLAKLPRRDYLISFVALSVDGVFRGCFALGSYLSRFVSFLFYSYPKRLKTFQFCPEEAVSCPMSVRWCDWRGEPQSVATPTPSPVLVSQCSAKASAKDILFRDPESFVAGEIHRHVGEWENILGSYSKQQEVFHHIRHKVNVKEFFVPFRGDFQGSFYDSATPPKMVFANNKSCIGFERFISDTIMAPFLFGEGLARFLLLTSLCPLQSNHLSQECAMTGAS